MRIIPAIRCNRLYEGIFVIALSVITVLYGYVNATKTKVVEQHYLTKKKNADMIVMNNPREEGAGFGTDTNAVTIYSKKGNQRIDKCSKFEVSNKILDYYLSLR